MIVGVRVKIRTRTSEIEIRRTKVGLSVWWSVIEMLFILCYKLNCYSGLSTQRSDDS
jgi:hypothetical protein